MHMTDAGPETVIDCTAECTEEGSPQEQTIQACSRCPSKVTPSRRVKDFLDLCQVFLRVSTRRFILSEGSVMFIFLVLINNPSWTFSQEQGKAEYLSMLRGERLNFSSSGPMQRNKDSILAAMEVRI